MATFRERDLTKGQLRKLTALRKSLGKGIADKAFAEWQAVNQINHPALLSVKDAEIGFLQNHTTLIYRTYL